MLESALFHQNDASTLIQDAYTPVRRDGQVEMDEEEHRIRQQAPDGAPLIGSYVASEYPVQGEEPLNDMGVDQNINNINLFNLRGMAPSLTPSNQASGRKPQ